MNAHQLKFRACLLAGAIGDALGAPVEFLSLGLIKKRFGPNGIEGYDRMATITDDTQMMLFTADGVIRACLAGDKDYAPKINEAYIRWIRTQQPFASGPADASLIFSTPSMHERRAPGLTCLRALEEKLHNPAADLYPKNDSKGCGSIMRAAPVGLMGWSLHKGNDLHWTWSLAAQSGSLTHGHKTSNNACGFFATLIQQLIAGKNIMDAINTNLEMLRYIEESKKPMDQAHEEIVEKISWFQRLMGHQAAPVHPSNVGGVSAHAGEVYAAVTNALTLAQSSKSTEKCLPMMGDGHTAESALAYGIFGMIRYQRLDDLLVSMVNHDGDSDSTASVAGNLWGARYGIEGIDNEKWLADLELRDLIIQVADDLYDCAPMKSLTQEVRSRMGSYYPIA